jgi:MoxR-like ATPase
VTDVAAVTARIAREAAFLHEVRREVEGVIVGQRALLDGLMIGLLADGHVLLEGVPGLAKSLAVQSLATAIGACSAASVHPDLLPSDLRAPRCTSRDWRVTVREGPVFNPVLADDQPAGGSQPEAMAERR